MQPHSRRESVLFLGRIFTYATALGGLGVVLWPHHFSMSFWWRYFLLVLLTIWVLFIVTLEFREWAASQRTSFASNSPEISAYLRGWLASGGRAAVFSRDLGWASNPESKEVLLAKAKEGKLILCLPRLIPLAEELGRSGAEVYIYPGLNYSPRSRFTIVNCDRSDARVSAGAVIHGKHVVRELSAGDDPFFGIAEDLVNVIRLLGSTEVK